MFKKYWEAYTKPPNTIFCTHNGLMAKVLDKNFYADADKHQAA